MSSLLRVGGQRAGDGRNAGRARYSLSSQDGRGGRSCTGFGLRLVRDAWGWLDRCVRRWNGGRGARWLAGGLGTASAVAAMTVLAPVPSLAQASVAQASVAQASPAQSARPAGGPGVSAGGAALAGFYSGGLLWSQGL